MFLEVFVDPTVIFCVVCVLTPLIVARDTLTEVDVKEYFTEPVMLCCLLGVPLAWLVGAALRSLRMRRLAKQQQLQTENIDRIREGDRINYDALMQPLSYGERTRARWYLLNGVIIHILMDGCVGVFKTSRLFAENYAKIDRRYGDPLGSFRGSAVHVVSMGELFVKGPVCILLYWAFQTRHSSRDALEFFTCVTQAYGTVVYLGQEFVSGLENFDVDRELSFTPHFIVYFWFAIFFGCLLYLVFPAILGLRSYRRLVRQSKYAMEHGSVSRCKSTSPIGKRPKKRQ